MAKREKVVVVVVHFVILIQGQNTDILKQRLIRLDILQGLQGPTLVWGIEHLYWRLEKQK